MKKGGLARRATAIKDEKAKSKNVLLLDAGDTLFGDRISDDNEGRPLVEGMNYLGYTAMAAGDREFNLGVEVLKARQTEMKFPLLSANAVISETGELIGKPYVIEKIDGRKVAIIGLTSPDAERVVRTMRTVKDPTSVKVLDPVLAAKEYVTKASKETNVIIILSHLGSTVDMQLAKDVPGITAIVGGHTRELMVPPLSIDPPGTWVMQAGNLAENLGIETLKIDEKGKATLVRGEPKVLTEDFQDDPEMVNLLAKYRQ